MSGETPLAECAANFSEGRRPEVVQEIAGAIASQEGTAILDVHLDHDHHRSVITFAGPPESIGEAAVRGIGKAVELIDMNQHRGVHPRIGAADVVPFIPLRRLSLVEAGWIAHAVGAEIWNRFQLPVYLYGDAAIEPQRRFLPNVRQGDYEGLRDAVRHDPSRFPDFGQAELHPTAGAVAVGARRVLIAWNVELDTSNLDIARRIATALRESSGGFTAVRALGLPLPSRGITQISMNLLDYEVTPPHVVMRAIERLAAGAGTNVAGSELVGLIPQRALDWAHEEGIDLRLSEAHRANTIEARLLAAGL
jgi:glutamate formiminotransferase